MHLVVHFEIARLKGKGWRVIAVLCTDNSKKNALNQVFAQLYWRMRNARSRKLASSCVRMPHHVAFTLPVHC
jgi:hypothetical protein